MLNLGTAVGYLDLDTSQFSSGIKSAIKDLKSLDDASTSVGDKISAIGAATKTVGTTLTKNLTLPLAGIAVAASTAAIGFESAFTGVIKTVDATDEELASLRQNILDMSREMPQSASQIAQVAEAAGQLGIEVRNIEGFTKVMLQLGDTTNLASTEAATALARFANITQMSQKDFDRLGSTIVALGNNLATTEAEIVQMGLGIAAAGKQVGMTEAQVLSFAGALSSVGLESAAGGTAISKLMIQIQLAVETGSEELKQFANIANMSISDFKKAFQEDAAGAIISFIKGLNDVERLGMSSIAVLDNMGFTEVRLRDAILRAAGAGDLFNNSIEIGTKAWRENLALTREAELRYGTTASKLKVLWNNITNLGISIGDILLPTLNKIIYSLSDFVKWLSNASDKTKNLIVNFGLILLAIGPVVTILGHFITVGALMVKGVTAIIGAFQLWQLHTHLAAMGTTNLTIAQKALNIVMSMNPIVAITLAIAALVAGILIWTGVTNAQKNAEKAMSDEVRNSISIYEGSKKAIDDNVNSMKGNVLLANSLIEELYALEKNTENTTTKQAEMKAMIDQLNNIIPDLNLNIDTETGMLNMQKGEVDSLVKSYEKLVIAKAYASKVEEAAKTYVTATEDLKKAEKNLRDAQGTRGSLDGGIFNAWNWGYDNDVKKEQANIIGLIKLKNESKEDLDNYQKQYMEMSKEIDKSNKETEESVKDTTEAIEELGDKGSKSYGYVASASSESAKKQKAAQEEIEKKKTESLKAEEERLDKLIKLNEDYFNKINEINSKMESDIENLNKQYNDAIESRANAITGSMSLFDKFTSTTNNSASSLLKNLQSQVDGLKTWRSELDKLEEKGIAKGLLKELESMGPSAVADLQKLNKMTDKQLDQYVALWDEKNKQALEQASYELQPLKDEINQQIQVVINTAQIKLNELNATYLTGLQELGISIAPVAEESGVQIIKAINIGIDRTEGEVLDNLRDLQKQITAIVRSINSTINSIQSVPAVDGSHANGLDYVPYDGYIAELHKGERVVPAKENKSNIYENSGSSKINVNVNFEGAPAQFVRELKPVITIDDKREGETF